MGRERADRCQPVLLNHSWCYRGYASWHFWRLIASLDASFYELDDPPSLAMLAPDKAQHSKPSLSWMTSAKMRMWSSLTSTPWSAG